MLSSSMRRVACSAPQAGLATIASSASKGVAASSVPILTRRHQRRWSSSKPSRSDSGASEIPAGQSVPASSTTARADTKASGSDKRKRKSKDTSAGDAASFKKLPSVPSTHHMSQDALGLSSFFSLHRPISITQTMPRPVTDEHFASIFATRTKSNKVTDTMSTLSDTIDQLEGPMAQMTIGGQHDDGMNDGMRRVEIKNPDGSDSSIYLQVDAMSGEFLPFRPPPLPRPQTAADVDAQGSEAMAAESGPQHRVYKAMFTIEESTEPDGQIRIMAHSPQIVQNEQSRGYAGRRDMHAISVKRQRKLKMKKFKYKKLMRRTRNLRRKLDRT